MSRRRITIKSAFVIAFFVVAALPVILAWFWPQQEARRFEEKIARDNHVVYTRAVAQSLQRYYQDTVTVFDFIASELAENDTTAPPHVAAMLEPMGFNHVCRFAVEDGALRAEAIQEGMPCPKTAPPKRLETIRNLAVEGQVRFSQVMLSPQNTPMMLMVRRDADAVAVGALSTMYFRTLGDTIKFGEKGHVAILDHTGRVLAHPKEEWINPPHDMSGLEVVQDLIAGGEGKTEFLSPAMNLEMYAAYRSVKGPGWGILVPQPKQEIENYIWEVKKQTLAVLLLSLALALLLSTLAAHLLLDSLRRIRIAAERVGKGTGDALIAPTGSGSWLTEIDDLRTTFNAMVLRIRNSQRTEIAARKEAQEANRFKSRFLANMSHELRTPLNAIIGFAEVTHRRLTQPEHERDQEYVGYIHDSGRHLLSIINDLLDLSRIEAGTWQLKESEIDLGDAVRDTFNMLTPLAQEKDITLSLQTLPEGLYLWADERAIKQIMVNLASNALRYTQNGGIVEIGAERDTSGTMSIWVKDNGPGINEHELERIRTPFARGRVHEKSAVPGAGLGLSIVDALSSMHNARFDLKSREGEGTIALVTFPPSRALLTLESAAE